MYHLCMKGNIYTTQKCPSCGGPMRHDERKHNCICSSCGIGATGDYVVRFGREVTKWCATYAEAAHILSGLRFKTSEGTFDARDYRSDNPLAVRHLVNKWLSIKEHQVAKSSYANLKRYILRAADAWGDRNVKTISAGDVEDFLFAPATAKSDKTRADIRSVINQFFTWLEEREGIRKPRIPKIEYELGWRTITDLDTQQAVIEEVARIHPPKVAFAIDLLASYTKLRPDDLRRVTEGDYRNGIVTFRNPTKKKNSAKVLRLLPEHDHLWQKFQEQHPALPSVKFFRHHDGKSNVVGQPYGERYLYKCWKSACANLGVEGLDLYGGTRHSTTTAIADLAGHDAAKKTSGHLTNKAFDRYCQAEDMTAFKMAEMVRETRKPAEVTHLQPTYNQKGRGKSAK